MPDNEDIPVAYIVSQDSQNTHVCEIAYAYDIENLQELTETNVEWIPINNRETYNMFYRRLIVNVIKLICTIGIFIFVINYIFINENFY